MPRRYLLIAPCRDESQYMRRTLDSVLAQTVRPTLFVIVDDGSTDDTPKILADYAAKHPGLFLIITRKDRGKRAVGPGVIEAFYEGYRAVKDRIDGHGGGDFDYLCKLDLDLDLPPRYFETLMERMEANPRLGTCSGKAYMPTNPADPGSPLVSEFLGDETSAGMTKFYRVACFKQIGGFVRQVMWDGIDCHRCRMLGWVAQSWDEPALRFTHLRPMGSSHKGIFTGRMRHGFGQWFMGTSLAYMTASALFRMTKRPFIVGGAAMWWGYVKSMLAREDRLEDPDFRAFLRAWQWNSLFKGKSRATADVNERHARDWNLARAPLPMPL
ncbi:MAG: glycosyltransferase family 2 protein [Phycisphaerales bacterium]